MGPDTTGDLGSILGIWAHPDDEAWLSSGLMMHALEAGHRAMCVTATRGEAGFPPDDTRSDAERTAVREAELAACLRILGVTEHLYLDYRDGGCAEVSDDEPVETLVGIIQDLRPDTVLCFSPDGATGHPDHISTCRWATKAVASAGLPGTRLLYSTRTTSWTERFFSGVDPSTIYMFPDFQPEHTAESDLAVWFTCDDEHVDRKVAALRAQVSQIEELAQSIGLDVYREVVREEFYREQTPDDVALLARMSLLRLP